MSVGWGCRAAQRANQPEQPILQIAGRLLGKLLLSIELEPIS
jgi:hypothetical protein